MAKPEAKAPAPAAAEGEAPPKKSKKVLIMLLALVVVLIGGGAGAFFMMKGGDEEALDDEEEVVEVKKKEPKKKKEGVELPPAFVEMQPFTANLSPGDDAQYLQLAISVEAEDMPTTDQIKLYTPKIRNEIILLLSGKKSSDLSSRESKEALAEDIRGIMNKIVAPGVKDKDAPVKAVFFTSFIMQ